MASDFERFTQAVQKAAKESDATRLTSSVNSVAVLGGGTDGKLLAALLLSEGFAVTLFSAYGSDMDSLNASGGVTLRGDGPTGTYQINREQAPSITTTAELDAAVASAELIFLTGPVHKQRTYAMVLADHLRDGQVLVIAPARTFGALETDWLLHVGGCRADYTIVELQHLPYWVEVNSNVLNLSVCENTTAAALPSTRSDAIEPLEKIYQQISLSPTVIHSGFSDAGGVVECVSMLFGNSIIHQSQESLPEGAEPLEERRTIRGLIENEYSRCMLESLLEERRNTAHQYGVRNLPDNDAWIDQFAGTVAGTGSRKIPEHNQAVEMIYCAVVGSMVALQSAGQLVGTSTPVTDSVIVAAGATLNRNLQTAGRKLEAMGVSSESGDAARRNLEAVARGER